MGERVHEKVSGARQNTFWRTNSMTGRCKYTNELVMQWGCLERPGSRGIAKPENAAKRRTLIQIS